MLMTMTLLDTLFMGTYVFLGNKACTVEKIFLVDPVTSLALCS
jgi:hypothetical protein